MDTILRKKLTKSEKERHWVKIPSAKRRFFPACDVIFAVKARNEKYDTHIDPYNRLRLGSRVFNKLDLDSPCAVFVCEKEHEQYFILRKEIEL